MLHVFTALSSTLGFGCPLKFTYYHSTNNECKTQHLPAVACG